jgi:hypothetical protein
MPPSEPPLAQLDRLLKQGDAVGALRVADQMLAQSKRTFGAWLGRAVALMQLGQIAEADAAVAEALKLSPGDAQAKLIQAMLDQRLGRIERAIAALMPIADSKSPQAVEAGVALSEVLWIAHRRDELAAFIAKGGAWRADPRAKLAVARMKSREDPTAAIEDLKGISADGRNQVLRRVAGFEAVGLLDKLGRYREAFDLAVALHAASTPPFDLEGMLIPVREQAALAAKREPWISARAEPVRDLAMVVGLPRSGTTLLEQMLDRHPAVSGIGEYDGVDAIAGALVSMGRWPRGLSTLPRDAAHAIQQRYVAGAQRLRRADAAWSFDKTLRAWRWLPAIAAVLPGTVCLHMARDPRDAAISTFLSYFHPIADGWTGSLASIRRVAEAERSLVPHALEVLGLPHEALVYEDFVADPALHVERCLRRMGLAMDPRVLSPEQNARAVFTLSHEQVRRPISGASIGRWRNYAFAFDGSWDAIAAAHDARRAAR